jgi:uncharacterized protein YceH (UPF0502 family)
MADEDTETTAEETPPASGDLDSRVGRLETMISELKDAITGGGGQGSETAPEPPANVAEEIRRQIEERDAREAARAADQAKTDRLGALETKVAELTEKPPEPMPRKVERIMGWR